MNKYLKLLILALYASINLSIFTGAFMFVLETFMTDTLNVKRILFGGAILLLLTKYFLNEIFSILNKSNDAKIGENDG